jgi:hypothetical protein
VGLPNGDKLFPEPAPAALNFDEGPCSVCRVFGRHFVTIEIFALGKYIVIGLFRSIYRIATVKVFGFSRLLLLVIF